MSKIQFTISLPRPNWCRQLGTRLRVRGWSAYAWGELGVLAVASLLVLRGGAVLLRASLDIDKRIAGDTDGAWLWFVLALALYGGWVWGTRRKKAIWRGAHPYLRFASPQPVTVPRAFAAKRRWVKPLTLLALAVLGTVLAYQWNVIQDEQGAVVEIELTARGTLAWVLSVVFWAWFLGADWRGAWNWARGWRGWLHWRAWDYTSWILLGMVALGALLRFWQFADVPPEMTSDHIEKLLDAWRVRDGYHAVFFYNNGGREAFQMYLVALLAELGVGYTFTALKLATVLEGLLTLPLQWWMVRQIIGKENWYTRRWGRWVGVVSVGLMAISSWHLVLSRFGLRIILTPLVTMLVVGFLARALRYNRTQDYLATGFWLGVGLYFYQAVRMLPALVIAGVGVALLAGVRRGRAQGWTVLLGDVVGSAALLVSPIFLWWYVAQWLRLNPSNTMQVWGDRLAALLPLWGMVVAALGALWWRRPEQRRSLQLIGGALVVFVVFAALSVPLYHYGQVRPEYLWWRTHGRVFGVNTFTRPDAQGNLVPYNPSWGEQLRWAWDKRDVFVQNYEDALLMFHWEGDTPWINNPNGNPALDAAAGGLLILGVAVWGAWLVRRRDVVWWLVVLDVLVMLIPSTLALAFPVENPSFTRTSGIMPGVYMLAALPLGALFVLLERLPMGRRRWSMGGVVALVILGSVLGWAQRWDRKNFFENYRYAYINGWLPYQSISKPLRAFVEGEGSFGNAFMIGYPFWMDHRILGGTAGDIHWPNGVGTCADIVATMKRNQGTSYEYDPTKPLLIMLHKDDAESIACLRQSFPSGELEQYEYRWQSGPHEWATDYFYLYRVPSGVVAPEILEK